MSVKKKTGFGSPKFPKKKHLEASSKGGQATGRSTGITILSPEERILNASRAGTARWDKVRRGRMLAGKSINSQ